jgi:hypothetical protein
MGPFDTTQPCLIVTYGNTTKKYRPLDKPVILVGRGTGCDLTIASPEIAPIHCILARSPEGWVVRNCAGKLGIRVNDRSVQEERLYHDDKLQVGAFSFRIHLPDSVPEETPGESFRGSSPHPEPGEGRETKRQPGAVHEVRETQRAEQSTTPSPSRQSRPGINLADLEHLRRSRRNLCRLALLMRDKLRKALAGDAGQRVDLDRELNQFTEQEEELTYQLEEVARVRRELEERETRIASDEAYLNMRAEKLEKELAAREQETEKRIEKAWEKFKKQTADCGLRIADCGLESNPQAAEEHRRLRLRCHELAAYTRHLRRCLDRARLAEPSLSRQPDNPQPDNPQPQVALSKTHIISREEMISALEDLRNENHTLRCRLAVHTFSSSASGGPTSNAARVQHQIQSLQLQVSTLQGDLLKRDKEVSELRDAADRREKTATTRVRHLQEQTSALEERLREREAELEKLRMEVDDRHIQFNLEHSGGYERELHRYRLELEANQKLLQEQIREMQERKSEVDSAARNAELEMSRERAMLSRERAELNRMREEISLARERIRREQGR